MSSRTNYFVCTLGEAADSKIASSNRFSTVNDFLEVQAKTFPDRPAVAFANIYKGEIGPDYSIYSKCSRAVS